jgi:virulence-associated protein VapD
MFHLCSLELMVSQCQLNEYHNDLREGLESSIYYLNSCQSSLISSFISSKSITEDELLYRLLNLSKSVESVRVSYKNIRLHRMENLLESTKIIQSEDYLSHAFFLFQLFNIVELLTEVTTNKKTKNNTKDKRKPISIKQFFLFEWSTFFLAFKSMIIIGIGSIFVMVPYLAKIFENGQWILITLCMTQADTVGGAFTAMKMRLIGTLLGLFI